MIDVLMFGAKGDGVTNDYAAVQAALDSGEKDVLIPKGTYIVDRTIRIPSHRHIHAVDARIVFVAGEKLTAGGFLVSNADVEDGNEDITIDGGTWDGGLGHEFNIKGPDLYAIDSPSGACVNFVTVKDLKLLNMTIANPIAFYIRLCRVRGFEIRNIGFDSYRPGPNQDGIHFAGYCRNGLVENVRALVKGQTNDDMIAFNADDDTLRHENRGLACGPIENIVCKNIYAEDCHTALRFASVVSPIRNIRIEDLYAGCRCNGINMDAGRYCRTPLFREENAPGGVGNVSDVCITGCTMFFTENAFDKSPLINIEENCRGFQITGLQRPADKDCFHGNPTVLARNLVGRTMTVDGETVVLDRKEREFRTFVSVASLRMD